MKQNDEIKNILSKRPLDTLSGKNPDCSIEKWEQLFLLSPSDQGVCRNGGRRGSKFAPKAILSQLSKMTAPKASYPHGSLVVSCESLEQKNFKDAQDHSIKLIQDALSKFKGESIIHLGGGHDHIYPLLSAIENQYGDSFERILILNIDAHLDTRTDNSAHSGTPFRQFSKQTKLELGLFQIGIHSFCNASSNFEKLPNGEMTVFNMDNIDKATEGYTKPLSHFLKETIKPCDKTLTLLSLDCDAIEAESMEAVSAVNHHGIPLKVVRDIFAFYTGLQKSHPNMIGIYEYNPIFDNLSNKGSRALSSLLYPLF